MKLKNWHLLRRPAINLQGWRGQLHQSLVDSGIDQPINSSLLLLAAALERPKTWILAHGEYEPNPQEIQHIHNLSNRVTDGQPLPYVLGQWEFFGRSFKVTPDVLIPRPETESLVEIALERLKGIRQPNIIDVGTGSGAIAISLAAELPSAKVLASDISRAALKIAQENAQRLSHPEIRFLQADLLAPLAVQFDLICANLPYIPTGKLQDLQVAQWEPRRALDGGESGLEVIVSLLQQARASLTPAGITLLEIEASLGPASLSVARSAFPQALIRLTTDLAGRDRILEILQS